MRRPAWSAALVAVCSAPFERGAARASSTDVPRTRAPSPPKPTRSSPRRSRTTPSSRRRRQEAAAARARVAPAGRPARPDADRRATRTTATSLSLGTRADVAPRSSWRSRRSRSRGSSACRSASRRRTPTAPRPRPERVGARARGGRAARLRGPPRGAREPPSRGRADRDLAGDRGGRSAPGTRPGWGRSRTSCAPRANGRASSSSGGETRPPRRERSSSCGAPLSARRTRRSRRRAGSSPVSSSASPPARGAPDEGPRRDARAEGRRPREGALASRRRPRAPQPQARLRRLRGLHEPRLAAPHVVRRRRRLHAALGRRGSSARSIAEAREPARVGLGDGGVPAAPGRGRARRRGSIRIRQLADESRLDAEALLVQDRLSVDAALASYRTGAVPFVTVLEALGTNFTGPPRRRRAARRASSAPTPTSASSRSTGTPPAAASPRRTPSSSSRRDVGRPR